MSVETLTPAPLGIHAKSTAALDSAAARRLERFELQSYARRLLPKERVARCLWVRQAHRELVGVLHAPAEQSAHYGGLQTCASVWNDPVCAAKITERRRDELAAGISFWRSLTGWVAIGAYTFAHTRHDELGAILSRFLGALESMTGARFYRRLREHYGLVGTIKALEVTYGGSDGWHPHGHTLMFFEREHDVDELQASLYAAWVAAASRFGLTMSPRRGLVVQASTAYVDQYLAKWGHEPTGRIWETPDELVKAHTKRAGRRAGDGDLHYTPFDLLRWVRDTGELEPIQRFTEYARVFKGRRQLVWSPGLRYRLRLDKETTDAEIAAKHTADAVLLANLNDEEWRAVRRFDQRAQLLELARNGDSAPVLQLVDELRRQMIGE